MTRKKVFEIFVLSVLITAILAWIGSYSILVFAQGVTGTFTVAMLLSAIFGMGFDD